MAQVETEGQTLIEVLERNWLVWPAGLAEGQRSHLESLLAILDRDGLLELRALVERELAKLEQAEEPEDEPAEPAGMASSAAGSLSSPGKKGGGWVELKYINGYGPYAYRRWREGKTLKSEYIGKVKKGGQQGGS